MKNFLFFILTFIIIVLTSCTDSDSIIDPIDGKQNLINTLSNGIKINIVNYDSLVIENYSNSIISIPAISAIEFGDKITGEFVPSQRIKPTYSDKLGLQFMFAVKVYENYQRAYHFTLRFFLEDSSIVDVDTFALMYKFPYQSAEIFLKYFDTIGLSITDFNLVNNELYFINFSEGLFKYDLTSKEQEQLYELNGNYYLAGNDDYQFIVYRGYMVYRYNVKSDTVDKIFNILPSYTPYIQGIEFYNDRFYVLILNVSSSEKDYLEVYNLDGDLIDTVLLLLEEKIWSVYNCAIYNNVLYCNDYSNSRMLKLDLNTNTFSDGKSLPARRNTGIDFGDDKFYYLDPHKQFIGTIPISEIK